MAGVEGTIEALEHRLMRSWVQSDVKAMRGIVSRRFRLVVGAAQPVMLDRKSLLEAAGGRWRIDGYRFGAVYAREVDGLAIFAAGLEWQGTIDGVDVTGRWWMADSWRKSRLTRRWSLLDRQLARLETESAVPQAVRALQLWR